MLESFDSFQQAGRMQPIPNFYVRLFWGRGNRPFRSVSLGGRWSHRLPFGEEVVVSNIHPTSVVSSKALVAPTASVGPFCVIESDVEIGAGCCLSAHAVIKQGVILNDDNQVGEAVVLGGMPQHKLPPEKPGSLVIGRGNVFREHVTVHRGLHGNDCTVIGDQNLIMVNAHVAHDCVLGNETILANNVMLAGHVDVGDQAYLSGGAAVHQFCRIGRLAMVGGQSHITKDVPPFVTVDGKSSLVVGLNLVGLKRAGLDREQIEQLTSAYRVAYRSSLPWTEMLELLRKKFPQGYAAELCRFMEQTQRGCVRERATPRQSSVIRLHRPDSQSGDSGSFSRAG